MSPQPPRSAATRLRPVGTRSRRCGSKAPATIGSSFRVTPLLVPDEEVTCKPGLYMLVSEDVVCSCCMRLLRKRLRHDTAGGGDGRVLCYDLRLAQGTPVAVLLQDSRAVTSVAFEDPWLACGTATGVASLVNVEDALRAPAQAAGNSSARRRGGPSSLPKPRRQLQGPGGAVHAVDMACGWLAVCSEAATVRTYRFGACSRADEPDEPQWRSRTGVPRAPRATTSSPLILATEPAHVCSPRLSNMALEPLWEPIAAES